MTNDTTNGVASLEAPLTEFDLSALNELLRSAAPPNAISRSRRLIR